MGHGRRLRSEERRAERSSGARVRSGTFIESGREERALVKAGDVVGDESRGAQAMVEDFDRNLAAVGVTGEGKLDGEFGGAIERVGIVRKQNVRHVAANQPLDIRKGLLLLAVARPFALVIDADEVEGGALESNLSVFVAQQFHNGLRV